jgi:tetratricopeptide (TPR) repeat protein
MKAALALLALALLALALRHDLIELALRQGAARLQTGEVAGAGKAIGNVATLGGDAAPLAYNLGDHLYRQNQYAEARKRYAEALTTAAPALAADLHFNLGNTAYREAAALAAQNPAAASGGYRQAIAEYDQALALRPATDAGANRALARAQATLLADRLARDAARQKADNPPPPNADTNGKPNGRRAGSRPNDKNAANQYTRQAKPAEDPTTRGKTRHAVTPQQAERLLNEARGREKLAGLPSRHPAPGKLATPEMDW